MFLQEGLYWKWAHEKSGDKVTDIPVKIVKGELAWSCCFCELPLSHNLLKACYTTSQDTLFKCVYNAAAYKKDPVTPFHLFLSILAFVGL